MLENDTFVLTAIDRVGCNKHNADKAVPCWEVHELYSTKRTPAICNRRAVRAGMNSPIDPRSLRKA